MPEPETGTAQSGGRAEVETFLRSLAEAVQAYTLYPSTHPLVEPRAEDLRGSLASLLRSREFLSIGVGAKQIFTEELETDLDDQALVSLARRLHAHELSRLTLFPAVDREEIHQFLEAVAVVPDETEDRLGRRSEVWTRWAGIAVETVQYDRITLGEGGEEAEDEDEQSTAAKLWLGLARAAHPLDLEMEDAAAGEGGLAPDRISEAIAGTGDGGRSEAVATQLLRIAEEVARGSDEEGFEDLEARLVELVRELSTDELYRVLRQGSERGHRHHFLLTSSEWLPADLLAELVERAGSVGDLSLSEGTLAVLTRMARHAAASDLASGGARDSAVRDLVQELVTAEVETSDQPGAYEEGLKSLAWDSRPHHGVRSRALARFDDPRVALEVGLEVDRMGEVGTEAFRRMRGQGRLGELTGLLADAPSGTVEEELWTEIATPEAVAYLLDRTPPNLDAVERLVDRVGPPAAEPMLDLLESAEARSVRGKLFRLLTGMGREIAGRVIERVDDDRWYVQRNMLALLAEMEEVPEEFSARPYTRHPRRAVRYEAYKILLGRGTEDRLIARLLDEDSERFVRLGLASAEPPLPQEVLSRVIQIARDETAGDRLRVHAVRPLGPARSSAALRTLVDLTTRRHWPFFWRRRLAEPSPVVVEAIRALASGWADDEEAREVLDLASSSEDPDVQQASRSHREEGP